MTQRQTQHQEELHTRIMDYAFAQFKRHGVKSVKVDDLAADLGISKRTLYELFGDKEGLLVECLRRQNGRRRREYDRLMEESENHIEAYVRGYLMRMREARDVSPAFFEDIGKYERVMTLFEEQSKLRYERGLHYLRQCVAEGLMRSDINLELSMRASDLAGRAIMESTLFRDYPLEELFVSLDLPHIRGLCTARGLQVLEESMKKYAGS